MYIACFCYCTFVFIAWAWLADPQVDVSEFVTIADCLHTRMFDVRRCAILYLRRRAFFVPSLTSRSTYCTLFIVVPGFMFLALGLFSSDVQFLRLSDCDIDSSTHVAVLLQQTCPASGTKAAVKKERKFVHKLQRGHSAGAVASFDFFGVRYVQVSAVYRCAVVFIFNVTFREMCNTEYQASIRQQPPVWLHFQ